MASDDKKTRTDPAPKKAAPAKEAVAKETAPKEVAAKEGSAKDKSASAAEPAKAEGGESAAPSPSNYSRGEGQKPVTKAYKDNWNAIFAKKKKR